MSNFCPKTTRNLMALYTVCSIIAAGIVSLRVQTVGKSKVQLVISQFIFQLNLSVVVFIVPRVV